MLLLDAAKLDQRVPVSCRSDRSCIAFHKFISMKCY
jgi:hypothetical protein